MMRVLLLGAGGQVGRGLFQRLHGACELHAPSSQELNLEDHGRLTTELQRLRPQLIVNAAAYTAVDRAEQEPERAMAVNARAPEILAREARDLDAALIHYSTDYVFDGTKAVAYTEADRPRPLNVYGRSKLAGDEAIQAQDGAYLIFRTSWVYALFGSNFLLTMRRLLREREVLKVVDDQVGAPTWADEIAAATVKILDQGADNSLEYVRQQRGLYNLSCGGQTSWFGFAEAIRARLAHEETCLAQLMPIPSEQYQTPAARPRFSVLDNHLLRRRFGVALADWQDTLDRAWDSVQAT